ncbi:constitutive coactivator of peroxisome proliferator-activated receptor gamma-like [Centruroides sculpturatus]|uniref:constitutive coactivator of peroxisome proliferator-activated receptor gamma-like n=1 Tax=Centruroides sculpturatus TaxID=218467 RepID=UPI000C6EBE47|nr:constitutive coactivator of peroxisome proliferator-activated receptor gamma-like [Centruroides sculpturatus]XP_023212368.1 constitutive coactivator of peroxisome proliferator-activated receptor gamma-like [Centruroides sculpturatus]
MGVKGLSYFVDNDCSEVCKRIYIPELASRYSVGGTPVLVVDGMSLINKMIQKDSNWVYGGQWMEYIENIKAFVNKFQQFGIELVFFYDGSVCKSKRTEWVSRRKKHLSETDGVFYYIKSTKRHPPETMFLLPTGMGSLTRCILKYEFHCEIRTTIGEADQEIADYANRNSNCFAILSQDSDFIIYNTKPYLSINHLNMDTLITVMYDRHQMAREINLDVSLFPLLSCLLGNDIIQADGLRNFHKSLCGLPYRNPRISELVPRTVELIRRNRWTGQEIEHIASVTNIDVKSLIQGISVYSLCNDVHNLPYEHTDTLAIARKITVNGEGPPVIYTLMCRQEYESSELLEDRNNTLIKPSALVYREVRKRLYFILFENKSVTVKEWCAYHGNPMEKPEYVVPEELDYQGPKLNLSVLWSNKPEFFDHQWELFRSCFGISIPSPELKKMPEEFMTLCCVLNFLILRPHLSGIEVWEVIAFICQAISPYARNADEIRKIYVKEVDARAVQLAALFMRGVNHVDSVATVCIGFFPRYYIMPWHFFDGKLFHHYYLMAKNGATLKTLCENQAKVSELLHSLYRVIKMGTPFPQTLSDQCLR